MQTYNKITLLGRVSKKEKLEKSKKDVTYLKFDIEVKDGYKTNTLSSFQCICFNEIAVSFNKYKNFGDEIMVSGKLAKQQQNNTTGLYKYSIIVDEIIYLRKKYELDKDDEYLDRPSVTSKEIEEPTESRMPEDINKAKEDVINSKTERTIDDYASDYLETRMKEPRGCRLTEEEKNIISEYISEQENKTDKDEILDEYFKDKVKDKEVFGITLGSEDSHKLDNSKLFIETEPEETPF